MAGKLSESYLLQDPALSVQAMQSRSLHSMLPAEAFPRASEVATNDELVWMVLVDSTRNGPKWVGPEGPSQKTAISRFYSTGCSTESAKLIARQELG